MAPRPDSRLDQQLLAFRSRLVAQAWDLRDRLEDELAMKDVETIEPPSGQPEGLIPRVWHRSRRGLGGAFCALRSAPILRRRSRTSTSQLIANDVDPVDSDEGPATAVIIIDVIATSKGEDQ